MRLRRFAAGVIAAAVAGGCAVGPRYQRPESSVTKGFPGKFLEEAAVPGLEWKPAKPADGETKGAWWSVFDAPELEKLERGVLLGSPTVAEAAARLRAAEAVTKATRAAYFPEVTAPAGWTRQRQSYSFPQNGHEARLTPTFNTITAGLEAGWEPDLWGRIRRSTEGARARAEAGRADLEGVRLSVAADAAAGYFTLRSKTEQRRLLGMTLEADRKALDLTRNRRNGGIGTDLDVAQAETQLRTVEAQTPVIDLEIARLRHALAALAGLPVADLSALESLPPLAEPPFLSAGLPGDLLQRRPDVASAEREVMAANASVGVAKAAFYPTFRIGGLAGFESVSAGNLLGIPNRYWSFGPTVSLPIFSGGRLRAGVEAAQASLEAAAAAYRNVVAGAVREVEDQLAAQRYLAEEYAAQKLGLDAARRTLEIATNRYNAGLVTYLEVVTAQTAALNFEQKVIDLRGQRWIAAVGLVRAIGGGWTGLDGGEGAKASGK
jgi:outer membrane protein, multidrug efflux system